MIFFLLHRRRYCSLNSFIFVTTLFLSSFEVDFINFQVFNLCSFFTYYQLFKIVKSY